MIGAALFIECYLTNPLQRYIGFNARLTLTLYAGNQCFEALFSAELKLNLCPFGAGRFFGYLSDRLANNKE